MAQESPEAQAATTEAASTESTPAPTRRKPRRATRPTMTPTDVEVAEPAAPAKKAEPAKEPAEPAKEPAEPTKEPAKEPAKKRAPRAKKAPAAQTPAAQAPGAEAPAVEEKAPSRPARRRSTSKTTAPEPVAPQSVATESVAPESTNAGSTNAGPTNSEPVATKPVVDVLAEFGKTEAKKASSSKSDSDQASGESPGSKSSGSKSNDLPKLDIEIPARPDQEKKPAADKAAESADVRLPATALLFQAPDIKPVRRSTRPESSPSSDVDQPAQASQKGSGGDKAQNRTQDNKGRDAKSQDAKSQDSKSQDSQSQDAKSQDTGAGEDSAESSSAPASGAPRRRRRGGRGRRRPQQDQQASGDDQTDENASDDKDSRKPAAKGDKSDSSQKQQPKDADDRGAADSEDESNDSGNSSRRRRRRRSRSGGDDAHVDVVDEVTALKGSTRLEAKRQRRRDGRDAGRRRSVITEAEFLARRESVDRKMIVRELEARTQIAVLEDDVLVEHYVARKSQSSMVGNVYLGRVQNVLPSMEAAFVDLGRGRNAVLYAGEVNWDAAGLEGGQPRRIEQALSSGDSVLVQVTKDPMGHKGARLTSQITLAGRYLVLVPSGAMTGISRKLPEPERARLKKLLKDIVPDGQGVIVRTAAEGATEEELRRDVERLTNQWKEIEKKSSRPSTAAPSLLKGEPELATRVVRDIFNEDFKELIVSGTESHKTISEYLGTVAPDLVERVQNWKNPQDVFAEYRIDEQLAKGMDRKVWLPSGGSLVIDRTEAMTVVDVNTGKFVGSGGTLEETVTRNNLEAAEEIVRQLRLRDIGGIIVIDFIDMVLESNRDLVLRRLVECLGRDRTRHQVAEVTSLGLVQMTRKRVGQGLVEAFSHNCEHCNGRGFIVDSAGDHDHGPAQSPQPAQEQAPRTQRSSRRSRNNKPAQKTEEPAAVAEPENKTPANPELDAEQREEVKATLAAIAAAAASAHEATEGEASDNKESKSPQEPAEKADESASEQTN